MRKETFLAILAGVTIGIIFAFGAWRLAKIFKKNAPINSPQPTPQLKTDLSITLENLNDFDVIYKDEVSFSGLTDPNSDVLVITNEKDFLTKSTDDGSFEIDVVLPAALSEIKVLGFNSLGQSSEAKINLVYSTEFAKSVEENTDLTKKPIAYVGTITDISSGTIQIKDGEGDIKQISLLEETKFINTLKKNIEVKSTDLAIGDYIIAMGFVNGNKVLKTQRLLITSPIEENKFEAKKITIEDLSKTKINNISLPKKWNGPDIKSLEIGQNIILVGLSNGDKFDIRSIFAVK
ncbi:MAG TPA: hypothetical protein VI795_00700 [Patescibacteria group bacterium]|nr:hypothetical protein [Patescibacteria group bacterium]